MISEKLIKQIAENNQAIFEKIFPSNYDYNVAAYECVNEKRAIEELERISQHISMDLKGKKILEIGSGFGMVVAIARKKYGAEAFGLEASEQFGATSDISTSVLNEMGIKENAIKNGFGENIPWEDNSFDIVYSSNVIEHVKDPAAVFAESIRVTKSGGYIIANVPNYGSWWEGHYGIFMLPYSPAWLIKLIVWFLGREPSFVDTLQLVTFKKLKKWIAPHAQTVEILNWGYELWLERMKTLSFSEWAMLGKLKKVLKIVNGCGLSRIVISMGTLFHWENPFFLVLRKK